MAEKKKQNIQILNRKAHHEYIISDTYEAGLVLVGCEVKSIRSGNASITEAFCRITKGEVFIYGMHIAPYEQGNYSNVEPLRVRKLLLAKSEIAKLGRKIDEKGFTIVPMKIYFSHGYAKIMIGIGQGKKLWDKRDSIAERDSNREKQRSLLRRTKGND